MKTCPSCNAACDERIVVCHACGYSFDETQSPASKRTMMGLPSIGDDDEPGGAHDADAPRRTLFGFPAQKSQVEEVEQGDEESDPYADANDDTYAMPAEELEKMYEGLEFDPRATVAGFPTADGPDGPALGDDESEQDDATMIAPGSLVDEVEARGNPGYSRPSSSTPDDASKSNFGTLLGMSVDEIESGQRSRATQFAIPAAQRDEEPVTLTDLEESSVDEDDSPTQAWSASRVEEIRQQIGQPDARQKLLDRLRATRDDLPNARETAKGIPGARETAKGIPGARKRGAGNEDKAGSSLGNLKIPRPPRPKKTQPGPGAPREDKLQPAASDETTTQPDRDFSTSKTPHSGVLRIGARRASGERSSEEGGVVGGGTYLKSKPEQEERKGVALGAIATRKKVALPSSDGSSTREMGDDLSDPEFGVADTRIKPASDLEETRQISNFHDTLPPGFASPGTDPQGESRFAVESSASHPQGTSADPLYAGDDVETFPDAPALSDDDLAGAPSGFGAAGTDPGAGFPPGAGRSQTAPTADPHPHAQASPPAHHPYRPPAPTTSARVAQHGVPGDEERLIRLIQSLFGVGAGLLVWIFLLLTVAMEESASSVATLVVLGLVAVFGALSVGLAFAPLDTKTRSTGYFVVAGLLVLGLVLGIVVSVPKWYFGIFMGLVVALIAGFFPLMFGRR